MQMSFVTGPNVDPRARTSVAGALERLGQYPAYFKQADHATLRQLSGKSRGSKVCGGGRSRYRTRLCIAIPC